MPESEKKSKPLYKRAPRGCAGVFFAFAVVCAATWGACLGYFVQLLEGAKTQLSVLDDFRPKVGSKFFDKDGELLGEYAVDYRQLVSLNEIPLFVQKAFVASEDHVFYEHRGVRPTAIASAMYFMLRTGRTRGGSTITQQIVRNLEGQLVGREQTIERKLKEMLIALQLEREYTKDEILELYLNQIFLGGSASGVEAASRQYFGKHCWDLTISEAALLAQVTPAPLYYRPDKHPEIAQKRRDYVLERMLENHFITQEEYNTAIQEKVGDCIISSEERLSMMAAGRGFWGPNTFLAPYFVDEVRKRIMNMGPQGGSVSKQSLLEGGLEIYTTLDLDLQLWAEKVLNDALEEFDKKKLDALKKAGQESEFTPVSGALVCLDNRPGREGFVRALVGGRDWEKQKYNTATQARRQPGSSVKPYVWAAAIADGMTPSTTELDTPFVRKDAAGNVWAPKNFDGEFKGPVTLRSALEQSRNVVSIRLVEKLRMPFVRSFMYDAGIRESEIPDYVGLTIALGTPNITILEQCTAYSTFAKNGAYTPPMFVTEIRDRDGLLWKQFEVHKEPAAIPPNVAYVVSYMMQGVAKWGTGARTAPLGDRPRAGKTGTTNDSKDAWFCGFTQEYTTVVWIGYRDARSLGKGTNYTGGRLACPVWTTFMLKAEEGLPVRDFEVPPGVVFYNVDKHSGLAGGNFREAFIEGTEPPAEPPVLQDEESMENLLDVNMLQQLSSSEPTAPATEPPTSTVSSPLVAPPAPAAPATPPSSDLLAPFE